MHVPSASGSTPKTMLPPRLQQMGVVVWSPLGAVHHGCRTVASHTIFSQQVAKELAGLRKKQKRDRRVAHLERFEAARAQKSQRQQNSVTGAAPPLPRASDFILQ